MEFSVLNVWSLQRNSAKTVQIKITLVIYILCYLYCLFITFTKIIISFKIRALLVPRSISALFWRPSIDSRNIKMNTAMCISNIYFFNTNSINFATIWLHRQHICNTRLILLHSISRQYSSLLFTLLIGVVRPQKAWKILVREIILGDFVYYIYWGSINEHENKGFFYPLIYMLQPKLNITKYSCCNILLYFIFLLYHMAGPLV